jgi:hypothetical protein
VDVKLDDNESVRFQGDLEFVESLRKLIPAGALGKGVSLDINQSRVHAGFAIALPPAAVGVFALKNIRFGTFLELPFTSGKPLVDFAFAQRQEPFLLQVAFLGGGGFFDLQLDLEGLRLLEAAFEFGATASLDIGVASGSVDIMAGIYFKLEKKQTDLDGPGRRRRGRRARGAIIDGAGGRGATPPAEMGHAVRSRRRPARGTLRPRAGADVARRTSRAIWRGRTFRARWPRSRPTTMVPPSAILTSPSGRGRLTSKTSPNRDGTGWSSRNGSTSRKPHDPARRG